MKILMISPGAPNETTSGLGFAAERIGKALSNQLKLTIVQSEDVNNQLNQSGGIDTHRFGDEEVVRDITRIRIKGNISPYLYSYVDGEDETKEADSKVKSELASFTEGVVDIARSLDFDIIYAHDWVTFEAALNLKRLTKKPLVLHVHSLDVDRISSNNHSWVFDIEKSALAAANAVISVSDYTADRIQQFYKVPSEKVHTIYNGCSLTLFPSYEKIFEDPVVLFAGRLTGQKAPQVFIEIADQVLAKNKNVRFVVAGDGPMKNSLQDTAAHKGIGNRIHFTGYADRNEMAKIFAESTIFCMPSLSEPFGLAIVEAAAAGLPVVISDHSGASEVLPKALISNVGDVEGFAQHIHSLIEHKVDVEAIISENKKATKNLTWEKAASEVVQVFNGLS